LISNKVEPHFEKTMSALLEVPDEKEKQRINQAITEQYSII